MPPNLCKVVDEMLKGNKKYLFYLHILLIVYSLSAVCSKLASTQKFLSFSFCLLYGIVLFLLALYALLWQQIIKHLPLTFAYANKAITVVWGILWGLLIFGEKITPGKVLGAVFVICGIVLYALNDGDTDESKENDCSGADSGQDSDLNKIPDVRDSVPGENGDAENE